MFTKIKKECNIIIVVGMEKNGDTRIENGVNRKVSENNVK